MHRRPQIDFWLLAPVAVLLLISLTTLLGVNGAYFQDQLFALGVAVCAFLVFSQADIKFLQQLKFPIYGISLLLLGIIFLLGFESRGALRWIEVFGVSIQFSEILKPFLALAFAAFLADKQILKMRTFFQTIALILPIVLLINFQPDLGSALIYGGAAFFTLLVAGFRLWWFGMAVLPILAALPFIWSILREYQRQRILTFLNPTSDPLGTSYNAIQAMIAVGSGSLFGKGLSEGTQSGLRFLPERQTDFIFATLAEGLGFVGGAIVILAFMFLGYRIYLLYRSTDDKFTKLFAACAFGFFIIQAAVNIGMNIGLVPIVGVTLPFVSFGGSSLVASFIFLGILSSLSVSHRERHVLEIR
jgi:rod shape determining protein RodA